MIDRQGRDPVEYFERDPKRFPLWSMSRTWILGGDRRRRKRDDRRCTHLRPIGNGGYPPLPGRARQFQVAHREHRGELPVSSPTKVLARSAPKSALRISQYPAQHHDRREREAYFAET